MALISQQPAPASEPYQLDDLDEWLLQNLASDDPVTLLRSDLKCARTDVLLQ
jgi:hypothetical protein